MKTQIGTTAPVRRGARGILVASRCLAVVAAIGGIALAGCGADEPSEAELKALAAYIGDWEGEDGTRISIQKDGTAGFEADGASVTGGTATLNQEQKKLKISGLLGISGTWTIDEPPHPAAGETRMKLDGMVYRRVAGFNADGGARPIGAAPAPAEMAPIAKATLLDLNNAIVSGDFAPFYATISRAWQAQTTPEQLRDAFQDFAAKKVDYRGIAGYEPVFEPAPALDENNLLNASGHYIVGPNRLDFALKYIWEEGEWRPFATNINFRIIGE